MIHDGMYCIQPWFVAHSNYGWEPISDTESHLIEERAFCIYLSSSDLLSNQ